MLLAIWAFLNSPIGMTLVIAPIAGMFVKWTKGDKKRERKVNLALEAFEAVEHMNIPGAEKYKKAISMWIDALRSEGLGMPSGSDNLMFEKAAERYSMRLKPRYKALPH